MPFSDEEKEEMAGIFASGLQKWDSLRKEEEAKAQAEKDAAEKDKKDKPDTTPPPRTLAERIFGR